MYGKHGKELHGISYNTTVSGYKYEYDANNNLSKLTCSLGGSSWSTVYTYDGDNRPLTTTLANGKAISNTYDAIGRLTRKRIGLTTNYDTNLTYLAGANGSQTALLGSYKNGSDLQYNYTYDNNGNITQIWRGNTTFASSTEKYSYVYDAANQLTRENLCYGTGNANNKTYTYEYDEWGNILYKKTYAYTIGSLIGGSAPANPGTPPTPTTGINIYLTDDNGTPLAGGVFEVYEYINNSWWYSETRTTNASGYAYAGWSGYSCGVKQVSAPTGYAMTDTNIQPVGNSGSLVVNYTNNLTLSTYPTQIVEYVYNNANWQDQLTSIKTYSVNSAGVQTLTNTQNFSYDAMGNPTSYMGSTLTWQGKQLTASSKTGQSISYAYDENGLRTQKTINNVTTNYYYNGSVLIGMTAGTVYQRFSYDSSGKVVAVDYSDDSGEHYTTYYYLRNGQGDIVKLIDNSGNTVVEYKYDTWGKQLSCTGTLATTLGQDQPFRYRGYVYDTETGWYYLQSRYYNPEVGRFISSDVLLSTGQGVLGHNAYAYCLNNPVNMAEGSGNIAVISAPSAMLHGDGLVQNTHGKRSGGKALPPKVMKPWDCKVPHIRDEILKAPKLDITTAKLEGYNCMGYAFGVKASICPQGYKTGDKVEEVFEQLVAEFGNRISRVYNPETVVLQEGQRLIAVRCSVTDFHFLKRDDDETWSGKNGSHGLTTDLSLDDVQADTWGNEYDANSEYGGKIIYFVLTMEGWQ